MNAGEIVSYVIQALVLPPGFSVLLLAMAWLSAKPGRRMLLLSLGLLSLYGCSIFATTQWLVGHLEKPYPAVTAESLSSAEAIVVLGADRRREAVEYGGGDTMNRLGLERLRYAAKLAKQSKLPVLASGGGSWEDDVPEAELMSAVLKEFGVEARWQEGGSKNTYENALNSSRLLKGIGIGEVALVTHAWHLPRAKECFERAGLKVIPAPTGMLSPSHQIDFRDFVPSASALLQNYWALHEIVGLWWYRWHYFKDQKSSS